MVETWKDIPDYPGYQVSNMGRVRTFNKVSSSKRYPLRHWQNRILKPKPLKGYCKVDLWNENGNCEFLIHRLVAKAFVLGETADAKFINHKNGVKNDNRADNLEWVTYKENTNHAFDTDLYSTNIKTTLVPVSGVGASLNFRSQTTASIALGRSAAYINTRLRKGRKTAFGVDGVEYFIHSGSK